MRNQAGGEGEVGQTRFGRALEKRVEERLGMCAVWAAGPVEPIWLRPGDNRPVEPIRFGTSSDPHEIIRVAAHWHWVEVELKAVVWCDSRKGAQDVARLLQDQISDMDAITDKWSDLSISQVEAAIRNAAAEARVNIFDPETKAERLQIEIAREIKKLKRR